MYFTSDNWAGAHPAVVESLARHASGFSAAYGSSELDRAAEARFAELFGREVRVFFVATGTAANALAITSVNRPGGVVFCHPEAHMMEDECGAPEYFSGGARLCGVDGALGRIDPSALDAAIRHYPAEFVHNGQPMAVSITQASEVGTVYPLDHIRDIGEVCRRHGLPLHMDGARFANALIALDTTPSAMAADIDVLSFGATKNGCWCAEALVFFNMGLADDMAFLRKRAGQLFSKSRFVAAQFEAYLQDDLWLETARHANSMAQRLACGLDQVPGVRLAWQAQANEVFALMPVRVRAALMEEGARFHEWPVPRGFAEPVPPHEVLCRFVASFATTDEHVEALLSLARKVTGYA